MGVCLFASCTSGHRSKERIHFFKTPVRVNKDLAKIWLSRSRRADLKFADLSYAHVVCHKHFNNHQVEVYSYGNEKRLRVKRGEVPLVNGEVPREPVILTQTEEISKLFSTMTTVVSEELIPVTDSACQEYNTNAMEEDGPDTNSYCKVEPRADDLTNSNLNVHEKLLLQPKSGYIEACQTIDFSAITPSPPDHNYSHTYQSDTDGNPDDHDDVEEDMSDDDLLDDDMSDGEDIHVVPSTGSTEDPVLEEKWIVFSSRIKALFVDVCCKQCRWPSLSELNFKAVGSNLVASATCSMCQEVYDRSSQPKLGRKFAGNVLVPSSIILSGQTYTSVAKVMELLRVHMISKQLYHRYQLALAVPAIKKVYEETVTAARDVVQKGDTPICLAGDGRFDSAGHSARYCTYTFLDAESGLATHCLTLQTAAQTSAVASEKEAFKQLTERAKKDFKAIKVITTDGHRGITQYMKDHVPHIAHNLDVWHWA